MHIEVIVEVAIALFAVYGVFCAIMLGVEHAFAARSFRIAVPVHPGESIERINNRLAYAEFVAKKERGAIPEPVLFVWEDEEDERIEEMKKLGVKLYIIKKS